MCARFAIFICKLLSNHQHLPAVGTLHHWCYNKDSSRQIHTANQPMIRSLHKPLSFLLVCAISQSSGAISVYHSIGKFGEPTYSQFPPQGRYTVLNFHLPAAPKAQPTTDIQRQCQILRDNLAALDAGGIIHEIDDTGKQTELNADEIALRKSQTQNALRQYCSWWVDWFATKPLLNEQN